jgi:hypothetical protein
MSSVARQEQESLLEAVQRRIAKWWSTRNEIYRDLKDVTGSGEATLNAFANDCGVAPATLISLIRRGPDASDEMAELMKALNIDAATVHFEAPALYRDMEVSCSLCPDKKRCRHELKGGTASQNYAHFCVNEVIMSELRAHPEFQME